MARKPFSYRDYQNCLECRSMCKVAIGLSIFSVVFTGILWYTLYGLIVSLCFLVISILLNSWIERSIARYEKEHFHSKDKENDSSDSSDSDTSPKS